MYNVLMLVQDNVSRSFTTCYIGEGLEIWEEISEEEVERGDSREKGELGFGREWKLVEGGKRVVAKRSGKAKITRQGSWFHVQLELGPPKRGDSEIVKYGG